MNQKKTLHRRVKIINQKKKLHDNVKDELSKLKQQLSSEILKTKSKIEIEKS